MLILFDNGVQRNLARFLAGHSVEEARAQGWDKFSNGKLIDMAEQAGFEVLVTTDKISGISRTLRFARLRWWCLGINNSSYVEVDVPFKE